MRRALDSINERIMTAVKRRDPNLVGFIGSQIPRLIAVSKLKPTSAIIEAYNCGQRYFGENYIQELFEKSNSPEIIAQCPDIKFHFIGHLQSNKVNKLLRVRNLHIMESVDSNKLADLLDKALMRQSSSNVVDSSDGEEVEQSSRQAINRLKVMIQVNTSGEDQKNGIQPELAPELAKHIVENCHQLDLAGLMTIGRYDGWPENSGPNKDFLTLYEVRSAVASRLNVQPGTLELSMGMSGDFEDAILMGSSNVRVGTLIFGQRPTKS